MKNLIILLIFSARLVAQTEIGNFKINEGEILWQKVYEKDLPIDSQDIMLRAIGLPRMTTTFWLTDIAGAKMKVQKKEGRTRITISDIYSVSSTKLDFGTVEENVKPSFAESIYLKRNKGTFSKLFLRKDHKLINDIIEKSISKLLSSAEEDDDW